MSPDPRTEDRATRTEDRAGFGLRIASSIETAVFLVLTVLILLVCMALGSALAGDLGLGLGPALAAVGIWVGAMPAPAGYRFPPAVLLGAGIGALGANGGLPERTLGAGGGVLVGGLAVALKRWALQPRHPHERLRTDRLELRPMTWSDWPTLEGYAADPEVVRHLSSRYVTRPRGVVSKRARYFALILRSEERLIGLCTLHRPKREPRQGVLGFVLGRPYWGQGYATEAAGAVLRFGFTELGLHRISASCHADDIGSWRVLEKIGMRQEACLREAVWVRGDWWTVRIYALLAHEGKE